NSGRSPSLAFRTIEKALSVVSGTDRIFIGAGNYPSDASQSFPTGTALQIIGDKDGTFTGDAGDICLQSSTGRYSVSLFNTESIAISGITFKSQIPQGQGRGLRIQRVENELLIQDCQFEDLYLAVYATYAESLKLISSTFQDADYGTYSNYNKEVTLQSVSFESFINGLYAYNVEQTNVSSVTSGLGNAGVSARYPVSVYSGNVTISDCAFDYAIRAITTSGVGEFLVDTVQVTNSTYGILSRADTFTCKNFDIQGTASTTGRGIDVYGSTIPELTDCKLANLHTAIYLDGPTSIVASGLQADSNSYGLRFGPNSADIDLDLSGVILQGNRYGVTATSGRENKAFDLANFKSDANEYAVVTKAGSFSIKDCAITGCRYGAIHYSGEKTQIQNCDIRPNDANSTMGMLIYSPSTSIDGLLVQGGYEGVRIYMNDVSDTAQIVNTSILDTTYRGLHLQNGTTSLASSNNVVISGPRHGLTTTDAHVVIDGFAPDSDYCFSFTRGTANVANVTMNEGVRFLYSSAQDDLKVTNVSTDAFTDRAYYIVNAQNVSLQDLVASANRNAVTCYYADNVQLHNLTLNDNTSNSVHLYNLIPPSTYLLDNVQIRGSTYGYRAVHYPFTPEVISKLSVSDANHAVRVEQTDAVAKGPDQLEVSGNRIALLCYDGTLRCEDIEVGETNQIGVYASNSPVTLDECKIDSSLYGALLYSPGSRIRDTHFEKATYAVYFAPVATDSGASYDLEIEDCSVAQSTIGAYLIGRNGIRPRVSVSKVAMQGLSSGLISSNCDLDVLSLSIDTCSSIGFRTTDCDARVSELAISNCDNWGSYCVGGKLDLARSRVHSRWGVYLASDTSTVLNTVIRDSYYGVYQRSGQAQLLQTTIGNVSGIGVYQIDGDLKMRNSIVDSRRYGLYKRYTTLASEHDYNLIHGDTNSFYNEAPALHEIDKNPIFVSTTGGDLHLAAGSPAINAGEDLSAVTSVDLEGNNRPSFRQYEMGAYEYTEAKGSLRVLNWQEMSQ
ncbi:MAG TPA: hypothetical protein DDW52_18260, partial [Planctomycetaceae bacterium]|nr:hypothetical protein [Planctomycetaceae bacterium]